MDRGAKRKSANGDQHDDLNAGMSSLVPKRVRLERQISLLFMNTGGGANPIEFLQDGSLLFDKRMETFMMEPAGLKLFNASIRSLDSISSMSALLPFVEQRTALLKSLPIAHPPDEEVDACALYVRHEKVIALINKRTRAHEDNHDSNMDVDATAAAHEPTLPETQTVVPTIFALMALMESIGDLDSENALNQLDDAVMCKYRFNPLNKSTTVCDAPAVTTDTVTSALNGLKIDVPILTTNQDGRVEVDMSRTSNEPPTSLENQGSSYVQDPKTEQFVVAMNTIQHLGAVRAFHSMVTTSVEHHLAWANKPDPWRESTKNKKMIAYKEDILTKPLSVMPDATGVLFFDTYTLYYLCFMLTETERTTLRTHYEAYLGNRVCIKLARLAADCDVVGTCEHQGGAGCGAQEHVSKVFTNDDGNVAVVTRREREAGRNGWKAADAVVNIEDMRRKVKASFIEDDTTDMERLDDRAPKNIFAKHHGGSAQTEWAKIDAEDIKKAKSALTTLYGKLAWADVALVNDPNTTVRIVALHGKSFKELCVGYEMVSPVNTLLSTALSKDDYADVVMGDFNVEMKKCPRFFGAVLELLERQAADAEARGADFSSEHAANKRAIAFLEGKGASKEKAMTFDPDIRVVPFCMATTTKKRSFAVPQTEKIHKNISEMKDFIFYRASKFDWFSQLQTPGADSDSALQVNSALWPFDHSALAATLVLRDRDRDRDRAAFRQMGTSSAFAGAGIAKKRICAIETGDFRYAKIGDCRLVVGKDGVLQMSLCGEAPFRSMTDAHAGKVLASDGALMEHLENRTFFDQELPDGVSLSHEMVVDEAEWNAMSEDVKRGLRAGFDKIKVNDEKRTPPL